MVSIYSCFIKEFVVKLHWPSASRFVMPLCRAFCMSRILPCHMAQSRTWEPWDPVVIRLEGTSGSHLAWPPFEQDPFPHKAEVSHFIPPSPATLCCREYIWSTLDKFNCAVTCTCTDTLQQLGHKLCLLQEPSRTAQWEMSGSSGAASWQHTLSIPWMQQRRHRGTKPLLPARQPALIPPLPDFRVVGA